MSTPKRKGLSASSILSKYEEEGWDCVGFVFVKVDTRGNYDSITVIDHSYPDTMYKAIFQAELDGNFTVGPEIKGVG